MNSVVEKVQELEGITSFSKHEKVVNGIINAIDDNIIGQGSMLPSVNKMVKELGFASKTIVKAYSELKNRGLIESKNRQGYFVVNEATDQTLKVALLIYSFHPFQEEFYHAFRNGLGENVQVDVYFHHNNIEVFETMVNNMVGKYGHYVVAPIPHAQTKQILGNIPSNKLLIVDRYEELESPFNYVTQEFEISTYQALKELKESIRQFDEIILYFFPDSDYPHEVERAFTKFLKDFNINGRVVKNYQIDSIEKGKVYFTIGDCDLWKLLKDASVKKYKVGHDIGVLSYNDSPIKEFISGGITTFSTDFEEMGKKAATFILSDNKDLNHVIPTVVARRASL